MVGDYLEIHKKPGRLSGLFRRLESEADKALNTYYKPNQRNCDKAERKILEWQERIGWTDRKRRHTCSYVNFIATVLDGVHAKVNKVLIDIIDYYDRAGKAPAPCYWAGADACEQWRSV